LTAAISILHYVLTGLTSDQSLFRIVIEGAAGLLLCAGLWTPIAGGLLTILAVWSAVSGGSDPWAQVLLASVGAALAMLGPGTWSIDARLFGRKRLIRDP